MSIISYTITHETNPCVEKEFLSIKQMVNFIAKKFNIPSQFKTDILVSTIETYTRSPLRGWASCLSQHITHFTPTSDSVVYDTIMEAIHKYQPNNIYKKFEKYMKDMEWWDIYQKGLSTRNHQNINHAFCDCDITFIIDQSLRWSRTHEGHDFWCDVDSTWERLAFAEKPSDIHRDKLVTLVKKYNG